MIESSLRAGDDMAAEVQKTPNRVTLESMQARIVEKEFYYPGHTPHLTIATLKLDNGFVLVGKSAPADPENFDRELGCRFAIDDALRQMWALEGYLLCEKLSES